MLPRAGAAVLLVAVLFPLSLAPHSTGQSGIAGLRYEHRKTDVPQSIHILEVDPFNFRIVAERALNDGVGRETVSSMAQRKGAVAAINGGFFRIGGRYNGEPEGILKIGIKWFSDPALPRGAIAWSETTAQAWIGRLMMKWRLGLGGADFPIDGINRPRAPDEAILYTWDFHRTTLTDPDGREILCSKNKVVSVQKGGDSSIPVGGYVYSIGEKSKVSLAGIKSRSPAKISYLLESVDGATTARFDGQKADYIMGGTPVLIRNGATVADFSGEQIRKGFAEDRHPRTAVGLRIDGSWVLVVADGRQPELSTGMTLQELANLMKSLRCVSALNLDGGGSSTMYLQGRVINSPSDSSKERPVSDAILIFSRAELPLKN